MKDIIYKIKKIKSLFKNNNVSYEQTGVNPGRDWTMILILANLIVLVSAGYSYYLYYKIDTDQFVSVDLISKEAETKINTDLLTKVVNDINNRSYVMDKIKTSAVPPDPSI